MKIFRVLLIASALALLGGCMMVPVSPGPPGYYEPAYVGPTIGIGIYGGGRHGRGYGGHGHWRR